MKNFRAVLFLYIFLPFSKVSLYMPQTKSRTDLRNMIEIWIAFRSTDFLVLIIL